MSTLFGGGTKSIAKSQTRAMGIDLQGSQYGPPITVVFGQNKVAGNVVWYGDFKATGHQQQQGGKGGGGGSSGTSYTYSSSFELGLCEGPATVINVYQGASTVSVARSGGITFTGAVGQPPWAHLTGSAAIGYSGTALAAFQNLQLGSSASLPNFNFEMAGRNQFGGGVVDANPADIMTAICTDTQIGVQFNALGDLTAFKNYCTAAGLFFSPVYNTQNPAQQSLDDLLKYANSAPFFSEGKLKVVPYGDATITGNGVTYTPILTAVADLGRDDFITNGPGDPVTIKRIGPADAMNLVRVEYKDRANTYHAGAVVASIDQDVVGTGSRAEQSSSVDMITNGATARLVAQNLLQRIYYIRNSYEFQLSWRYCYLEPMDIVTLTDANTGLYLSPVRITEISEDEHGLLSIVAEEMPDGVSHGGTYATQANAGTTVDPNANPGPIDGPYLFRGPGFLVSNNAPEIWCALAGNDALWAGCDVYLSHDGTSYSYMATTSRRASYGVLSNTLASAADPDTAGAPNVLLNGPAQLLGGTQADADQFVTLAMVDNEIIAYQTATLAGGPSYTLGYLRRGGYGSAIAAHVANAPFVRLDANILRIPIDPSQIGLTVYLKFVSFNVFGKGGRTLADETAYPYVIGTNVELPDVPVTPVSFASQSVADGVSLTWINPNPAAVGSTSIEFATASAGPWTVLAQVGPTHTSYAHHFTTGATYYYRARSRGPLVSAGFSGYTGTVTNAGVNVAAIITTANAANANVPAVINPQFANGLTGWTPGNPTGWSVQTGGANLPDPVVNTAVVHTGGSATDALVNTGHIPVVVGQQVTVTCCVREVGVNAGALGYARISWRDAGNLEIGTSAPNGTAAFPTCGAAGTGTYVQGVTKVIAPAPAGAQYAVAEPTITGQTAGTFLFSNVCMVAQPSSVDELPDGTNYGRTAAGYLNANRPLMDFGDTWHRNKNLDYLGDGANYGRTRLAALINGTIPLSGAGKSLIGNPTFSRNTMGIAKGGATAVGAYAVDNWKVSLNQNPALWSLIPESGDILFRLASGAALGTGAQVVAELQSETFPVSTGQVIVGELNGTVAFGSSPPAGVSTFLRLSLVWLKADGTVITGTTCCQVDRATTVIRGSVTAPANTVSAYLTLDAYLVNLSGATYTAGSLPYDCRIVSAQAYSVSDLATEVTGTLSTQRNLPAVTFGNYGSGWNGLSLSYTSTTTSATISASAATLQAGGDAVSYNASSLTLSGTASTTVTYYLFYDDPTLAGGAATLQATTNQITSVSSNGRVAVAKITVTYPASGTGGGGGTPACVSVESWVRRKTASGYEDVRAGTIVIGDRLRMIDPATGAKRWGVVSYSQTVPSECVRVTTAHGITLSCSTTAPIGNDAGEQVLAPALLEHRVPADDHGALTHAEVTDVRPIGIADVQHITCEDGFFLAGDQIGRYLAHHNKLVP